MELIENLTKALGIPRWGTAPLDRCGPYLPCRGAELLNQRHRTVICFLFPYFTGEMPGRNLSRYACVPDYHRVAGGMLRQMAESLSEQLPGHEFLPFVDSSPIREVRAAVEAGLGCRGENGLLIAPDYGSYVFLGEIVTDLALPPRQPPGGHCLGCGKCRRQCPGRAIGEDGILTERCLSHITQKRGELTEEEARLLASTGIIWGCDRCQEICPMNQDVKKSPIPAFYQDRVERLELPVTRGEVRGRAFGFRGPGVLRRNLRIMAGQKADTRGEYSLKEGGVRLEDSSDHEGGCGDGSAVGNLTQPEQKNG